MRKSIIILPLDQTQPLFAAKIEGSNGRGNVIGRLELLRLLEVQPWLHPHFSCIKLLLPNTNDLQGEMMHRFASKHQTVSTAL